LRAFHFYFQYHDNPEQALIANANIGGENCHRGAALAALVGSGSSADGFWPSRWMQGLHDKRAIDLEIQIYLSSFGHVDQTKSDL
jgi:ADP-ribosyl-[dinitrogen reductase] hydrolase